MSNRDYIISLCQQLQAQGKTPSVALVRNKANRQLPIPEVIKALQSYKAEPSQKIDLSVLEEEVPPQTLEQRVERLEQQVNELTSALEKLTAG